LALLEQAASCGGMVKGPWIARGNRLLVVRLAGTRREARPFTVNRIHHLGFLKQLTPDR
jgi:hypothetical protein